MEKKNICILLLITLKGKIIGFEKANIFNGFGFVYGDEIAGTG